MPYYTVIGVYDDGQTFADDTSAIDPFEAMRRVALTVSDATELQILGAIEGVQTLVAACDESGNAAYAMDLTE